MAGQHLIAQVERAEEVKICFNLSNNCVQRTLSNEREIKKCLNHKKKTNIAYVSGTQSGVRQWFLCVWTNIKRPWAIGFANFRKEYFSPTSYSLELLSRASLSNFIVKNLVVVCISANSNDSNVTWPF